MGGNQNSEPEVREPPTGDADICRRRLGTEHMTSMQHSALALVLLFGVLVYLFLLSKQHRLSISRLERKVEAMAAHLTAKIDDSQMGVVNAVTLNSTSFAFPVPLDGPSIDPHHARTLCFLLQAKRPRRVLELGSGSSTVYISTLLRRLAAPPEVHIAVDHDRRFLDLTEELCRLNHCAKNIQFVHGPLGQVGDHPMPWYQIPPTALSQGPFDLIVVDGPPAYESHLVRAREPALPVLMSSLASGGVLILDDTNRPGEQKVLSAWRKAFPQLTFEHRTVGKGHTLISHAPLF